MYIQLSQSLDLIGENQSLNAIKNKNYSIVIKPEKQSKYYKILKKSDFTQN